MLVSTSICDIYLLLSHLPVIYTSWWVLLPISFTCCESFYLWQLPVGKSLSIFEIYLLMSPSICEIYLLVSSFTCDIYLLVNPSICDIYLLVSPSTCDIYLLVSSFTCEIYLLVSPFTCDIYLLVSSFYLWYTPVGESLYLWHLPVGEFLLPVIYTCWWVPFICDIYLLVSSFYLWYIPVGEFLYLRLLVAPGLVEVRVSLPPVGDVYVPWLGDGTECLAASVTVLSPQRLLRGSGLRVPAYCPLILALIVMDFILFL